MFNFIRRLIKSKPPLNPNNVTSETLEQIAANYELRIAQLLHELHVSRNQSDVFASQLRISGIDPHDFQLDASGKLGHRIEATMHEIEDTWESHISQALKSMGNSNVPEFQQLAKILPSLFSEQLKETKRLVAASEKIHKQALELAKECNVYRAELERLGIDPNSLTDL